MGISAPVAAVAHLKSSLVHLQSNVNDGGLSLRHVSFAAEVVGDAPASSPKAAAAAKVEAAAVAAEAEDGAAEDDARDDAAEAAAAAEDDAANESEKAAAAATEAEAVQEEEDESSEEDEEEEVDWVLPRKDGAVHDERDKRTSDEWVVRHPEMIRLTGRHPFNAEAPLSLLMQQGFITPASLHYVRNHGAVPRGSWETWRLHVGGAGARRPLTFVGMDELLRRFPRQRQLPVTLVCAGNRRKEQNTVRQSVGFNWGAAGVSTSLWRGIRLRDVILAARPRRRTARFVCFEGADTLPKSVAANQANGAAGGTAGNGYGTCITIEKALDEGSDVLLAFMQNGELLRPDHGYPLRVIIPGFIGGRMVKWLTGIYLSDKPSANYYHLHDNKVFPSHVDSDTANEEDWWARPEYVINDLNINSVMTTPSHGEILPINPGIQAPYSLEGYAYSGGGRKVTRVEVTLDDGESWRLCSITQPERATEYGKHWCWIFWQLQVDIVELLQARELAVRAWDESMNTQPKDLIWNLMGMMSNCWFRVRVHPTKGKLGGLALAFEHPTQAGNLPGGWMVKKEAAAPPRSMVKSASTPFLNLAAASSRAITMSEVRRHSKAESPWIVVHNHVYDCTRFLKEHPGGADSILINAGSDCSEEFDAIHSSRAKALLEDFKIGELVVSSSASVTNLSSSADTTPEGSVRGGNRVQAALLQPIPEMNPNQGPRPCALANPKQGVACRLASVQRVSGDIRLLRFQLPFPDQHLGLPVGKHVFVSAKVNGKLCMRAYTPVSAEDDAGVLELLIRVYYAGVNPAFPSGGIMSQHLDSLKPGDTITIKGPLGHIEYHGDGDFTIRGQRRRFEELAMVAGGTGITPVFQVIRAVLRNPADRTRLWLLFANRTEADIMLRSELDGWASAQPERFRLWYVLSSPPQDWSFSSGYINEEIARQHLPPGSSDSAAAFMCGPPPMIDRACLPNLAKLGYTKDRCFQF